MLFKPLAVVGPSGIGKGTLIRHLVKKHPHMFQRSISHTTRKPRTIEKPGFDYHFVNQQTFKSMVSTNDMVESAVVHGNYYGTSRKQLEKIGSTGRIPLLDIDIRGVESISKLMPIQAIFLLPPSHSVWQARLRNRGTQSEESIRKRMKRGLEEIAEAQSNPANLFMFVVNYDYHLTAFSLKYLIKNSYGIDLKTQLN